MDALLCDEILQEIFRRLPPSSSSVVSLVSKWCGFVSSALPPHPSLSFYMNLMLLWFSPLSSCSIPIYLFSPSTPPHPPLSHLKHLSIQSIANSYDFEYLKLGNNLLDEFPDSKLNLESLCLSGIGMVEAKMAYSNSSEKPSVIYKNWISACLLILTATLLWL
nr:F-box/LRR-repeat protein 2 [Ipomoea trifida]